MNTLIITTPFSNHHTAYFSFDPDYNVVVFNVVGDGSNSVDNHHIILQGGSNPPPNDDILWELGLGGDPTYFSALPSLSICGQGIAYFPSPPFNVAEAMKDTFNISFPSLNITTLFSTGSLKNSNNVIHSIPIDLNNVKYLGSGFIGSSVNCGNQNYCYEPTHREENELNNDGNEILSSLRVQILNNNGQLSSFVSIITGDNADKVVIVVNIDTEKEKQNDILRKVKDDKLYEKYSRNFVNYNP